MGRLGGHVNADDKAVLVPVNASQHDAKAPTNPLFSGQVFGVRVMPGLGLNVVFVEISLIQDNKCLRRDHPFVGRVRAILPHSLDVGASVTDVGCRLMPAVPPAGLAEEETGLTQRPAQPIS